MKYFVKFFIGVFIIFYSASSFAQNGWYQMISNTGNNMHGIYFYSENFGFAVGQNGALRKTTNGGINWNLASLGVTLDLHKVTCLDSATWLIIGEDGLILRSSDAGGSWTIKNAGTSGNLGNISFIRENGVLSDTGYTTAVNGILVKTTDAGNSWTSTQMATAQNLYFVKFVNKNVGYVGGKGITFKTTNSGSSWTNVSPSNTNELSRCDFRDENNGIIVGGSNFSNDGVIYRTTNGGLNWSTFQTPFGALKSVQYLPNGDIFIIGNGALLMSYDDGASWTIQSSSVSGFFHDAYFVNNETGYGVGNGGVIIKTRSGGLITGINTLSSETPASFKLHQNYPNPFNPSTRIKFDLPEASKVSLVIYNSLGQQVSSLVDKNLQPGVYEYTFNAENLISGVYFYKLITNEFSEVKKMILVK